MADSQVMAETTKLLQQALVLHRAGDIGAAAQLYQKILILDPHHADAYQLLAVIARQMGNHTLAQNLLEQAIALHPQHVTALSNLALLLREQGDIAAATLHARAAVTADPKAAEARIALGGVLVAQRDYTAALEHYRLAIVMQPENILLLNDIANAERRLGHHAAAYATINQAITLASKPRKDAPLLAMLHHTRGTILRSAGYPDLAVADYQTAMQLDPTLQSARDNAAMCHLLLGDFAAGWVLYAGRGTIESRYTALPEWNGATADKVLIYAEQGLGDTLQFVRLIRAAQHNAASIVLEVQAPLHSLLQHSYPDLTIITPNDPLPEGLTARCRMLDLPRFFSIPITMYLSAPPLAAEIAARIEAQQSPRIGLVWAGNPGHLNDAHRSLSLAQLVPILRPHQQHCVSLQKTMVSGAGRQNAPNAELVASGLAIPDGGTWCSNFAETAALVQSLDLVLTVDTAVAHLAGGLGKPVWLLLPYDPDWRWLLQRQDSPWYPTMKLYRQTHPHDWSAPLAQIATDLTHLMSGDLSILQPVTWQGTPAQRPEQPVDLSIKLRT